MKTEKITFVIDGQEPQARSIFAVEGMTSNQLESFNNQHRVYVGKNSDGIFFTKELSGAFVFDSEDDAENVKTGFENSNNMANCDWSTIILVNGVIATEDQLVAYANGLIGN